MLGIIVLVVIILSYIYDAHQDKKLRERVYSAVEAHQKQEIERLKAQLAQKN